MIERLIPSARVLIFEIECENLISINCTMLNCAVKIDVFLQKRTFEIYVLQHNVRI